MNLQLNLRSSAVLAYPIVLLACLSAGAQNAQKNANDSNSPTLVAQDTAQPAPAPSAPETQHVPIVTQPVHILPATPAVREAWRKSMVKTPRPKNGCFKAEYPSTEWQEVPCGRPSPHPNVRRGKARTDQVGNGTDYVVQATGSNLISSAEGSFLPFPDAPGGVSGNVLGGSTAVNNIFMLQMNTQSEFNRLSGFNSYPSNFSTPACNGAPNGASGCYGWLQFLFTQTQGPAPGSGQESVPGAAGTTPGVFIEYWLNNWGSPCPTLPAWAVPPGSPATTLWTSSGSDCWFNGPVTYLPPQTVADLPGLVMTSSSNASQDTVSLSTTSGIYTYAEPSVLSLSQAWTQVEFIISGDCCSSETSFTSPTVLVVKNSIDDGSTSAPICVANDGTTGETNNLSFQPASTPVCCPYSGTDPSIEFMEVYDTSHTHTASCGSSSITGEPHITTVNGTYYNFQAAGEFVSLLDADGTQIQTRQTPLPTVAPGNYDPGGLDNDGLTSCLAMNTAVAARVGAHRVTYEPSFNGAYGSGAFQLRVDGKVTTLDARGVNLGEGGQVKNSSAGAGAIEVDFPDGKVMIAVPSGAYDSMNYLNVQLENLGFVSGAGGPPEGGIAGTVPNGSWLPALPSGASVGPMPASLHGRYVTLYSTFGDAWRVTSSDSLFDYASGTSTATFTNAAWPVENTTTCTIPHEKTIKPATAAVAAEACKLITDAALHSSCVFDVQATGNRGFAATYLVNQRVHAALNFKPIDAQHFVTDTK